jgi:hypothetical protein
MACSYGRRYGRMTEKPLDQGGGRWSMWRRCWRRTKGGDAGWAWPQATKDPPEGKGKEWKRKKWPSWPPEVDNDTPTPRVPDTRRASTAALHDSQESGGTMTSLVARGASRASREIACAVLRMEHATTFANISQQVSAVSSQNRLCFDSNADRGVVDPRISWPSGRPTGS